VVTSTAAQLLDYMTFRANRERVEHTLTLEFYQQALDKGCQAFFGVVTGSVGLQADVQQPELFKVEDKRSC
jgi:hypothetical protein